VFIAHTKILSAIRLHAKPRRKINITVPKPEHFMHRAMPECSRLLWSSVYLFSDSVSSLDRQKNMNDVNRFLEEGILQAIRNLLPVKSILRDSLQEDDDDAIHIAQPEESIVAQGAPLAPEVPVAPEVPEEPLAEPLQEETQQVAAEVAPEALVLDISGSDMAPLAPLTQSPSFSPTVTSNNTLVVDTEKSVGFTGMDAVFGDSGHAELRPMIEEGSDEFKILGESEDLNLDEIEDLDQEPFVPEPLGANDYETL
jgi:hypothetical protein